MEGKLREHEYRLLDIIWNNEPLPSKKLVALAAEQFGWKPTTTYTVIKNAVKCRLCRKCKFCRAFARIARAGAEGGQC